MNSSPLHSCCSLSTHILLLSDIKPPITFLNKTLIHQHSYAFFSPIRATRPAHFIFVGLRTPIILGEEHKLWIFHCAFVSRLLWPRHSWIKTFQPAHYWVKRDQRDVTCFIISLFNAQHVSDVDTSILRNLRLICWVISWVVLLWFDVLVLRCGLAVVLWYPYAGWGTNASACIRIPQYTSNQSNTTHEITQQISCKFVRMDVLTSETCWALNKEIIKQVTSSWSLFTQLSRWCTVQ